MRRFPSTEAENPLVHFVILNWNQTDLTLACLQSVFNQDYPALRVIVVDNGSTDGSASIIKSAYPQATVLETGTNVGYSLGNNIGIQCAMQDKADYVFLLNNDTELDRYMLSELVAVAESDPEIGVTGPTMLYYGAPETIWCAGNSIDWHSGATHRLRADNDVRTLVNESNEQVDFITSCAVCIKRMVFEEIGLMDKRFFIYYDEADWFVRAATAGWRTVYVPSAKMWHKVSATMGESSPSTDYYMVRNSFLFLAKNLHGTRRVRSIAIRAFDVMRMIAAYTLKNRNAVRLRNRDAKLLAIRDALLGRWGQMGKDVAVILAVS